MSSPAPTFPRPLSEPLDALWSEFTGLFSNILFAVSLFCVWGLLTLIGVIVDQGKDASFYTDNYAPALARLVLRLDLNNIYHSTAYVGIIGLILVSLAVCTFKRVIPARLPPLRAVKIENIPLNATVRVKGDESNVRARLEAFFAERGWTVRKRELGGVEWTFADRHNWARRGVLVAHVGFVIIAAGTTLYWWKGFSGQAVVLSGQTVNVPRSGATLHLDHFGYRFEPIVTKSGTIFQPLDYVSNLHVAGRDGITSAQTLRVNAPIDIDDTLYYQDSYGFAATLDVTKDGHPLAGAPTGPIMEGDGFALGQTARSVQYTRFVGTIAHEAHGDLGIAPDPRPNDPGVILSFFDGDQPVGTVLIPLGKTTNLGDGYQITPRLFTPFSLITYRHDPGVPLVGIGAFVLLAGLCIAFYLLPARLYVRVDGADHAWAIRIAATTVKGYDIFEEQFGDLIEALRRSEQPAPRVGDLAAVRT
ncbi:MAG TPA: cytochrome c biogenesis protein ResB [Candidatus Baltobacteraceae bacterium]